MSQLPSDEQEPVAAARADAAKPDGAGAAAPPAPGDPGAEGGPGVRDTEDDALAAAEEAVSLDVDELASAAAERDEYRSLAQRIQADFENYKKRVTKQQGEQQERAAEALVAKLLPVLDTADLALAHDPSGSLAQVVTALTDALAKEGLERIDPVGEAFDPTEHDAVLHEPAGEVGDKPEVVEVMRAGYRWKGRVLRPAMVKVRG